MAEKGIQGASTTHQEVIAHNALPNSKVEEEPVYEEVCYGYSGIRGLMKSPYVFGATFLASMGGFSYGYGMSRSR